MNKIATCRGCQRKVEADKPPSGWYSLSVNVPEWFNAHTTKPYRWIGMFCSVGCLISYEPKLIAWEELMHGAYERS